MGEYRTFSMNNGFYNIALWGQPPSVGTTGFDGFRLEVVYSGGSGPVPPVTQNFTNQGYFACSICGIYNEGCDQMGNCTKQYLAQAGTVTITSADRNAQQGRILGSATNVRFNEWNIATDQAIAGGGCVIASSIGPWDVGWNADGGAPPP